MRLQGVTTENTVLRITAVRKCDLKLDLVCLKKGESKKEMMTRMKGGLSHLQGALTCCSARV
jgi:hypothetical protein